MCCFHFSFHTSVFIFSFMSSLDIYCKIVMFTWWQRIWNTDLQHHPQQKISIKNVTTPRQKHLANPRRSTHTPHQMSCSIHSCQSKCIQMFSTKEQSPRMKSFCSLIILIHCFNVFVLAIASENSSSTQSCDRTRRVFTEILGEISNGPFGSNYTQVSILFVLFFSSSQLSFISFDLMCDRQLYFLLV